MDKKKEFGEVNFCAARQRKASGKRRRLFRKSDSGAAAIEFAIVAPIFFMLTFGIFEVGINYMADRLLAAGLEAASRKVRTGQVRASPTYGLAQFKAELCAEPTMFLFDCSKLLVDVKTVASFEEDSFDTNDDGSVDTTGFGFSPGGRTTINVVRAFYEWPTVINWVQFGQAHGYQIDAFDENARIIFSSNAFLTEPFS